MNLPSPVIDRARYESFGGIVSSNNPPFLAWVDRNFMREMGYDDSLLWKDEGGETCYLSAPIEAHVSITNRCSGHCDGCYMNAHDVQSAHADELTTVAWKLHLKTLRQMGVFHVALGGGEAFERKDFGEIVAFCREIGLVPNLTTSGQSIGKREVKICTMMGQVNVSIDGIKDRYSVNGRKGSFEKADAAITALRKSSKAIGINCVISRKNFPFLEDVIAYAKKKNLNEIEFLKYKPSGRGKHRYPAYALTQEMIRSLNPSLVSLSEKYGIEIKIDCSFIPALVYHKPRKADLEKLAVTGCDGGNLLMSVRSNGSFAGCSLWKITSRLER